MNNLKPCIGDIVDAKIISGDSLGYSYHSIYKKGGKEFDGKIVFSTINIAEADKLKIQQTLDKSKIQH